MNRGLPVAVVCRSVRARIVRCALQRLQHAVGLAFAVGAAHAEEPDARALALAGCGVLHQLNESPGALVDSGFILQCGSRTSFAGSSLSTRSVVVRSGHSRYAWEVGVAHEASDVHARQRLATAVQLGGAVWRVGVGVEAAKVELPPYPAWHDLQLRTGVGARLGASRRVAAVAWQALRARAIPECAVGMAWQLLNALEAVVQIERTPGLPLRTRMGGRWGNGPRWAVLGGFDVTTLGTSAGLVAGAGPWRFTYGTQSHPDLGWSHAWSLEFRR